MTHRGQALPCHRALHGEGIKKESLTYHTLHINTDPAQNSSVPQSIGKPHKIFGIEAVPFAVKAQSGATQAHGPRFKAISTINMEPGMKG